VPDQKFFGIISPVYHVIQTFVYDATPHDKVPTVRYVQPLLDTQRALLEHTMTHDPSPRARARAHSLLLSAEGMTIKAITKIYQVDRDTVSTWIRKWERDGPASLHDQPRSGRPPKLTPDEQTLAIAYIKEEPRSLKQVVERLTQKAAKRLSISSLKRLAKRPCCLCPVSTGT
jgi:transposase